MRQENVEVVRRAFDILKEGAKHDDPGAAFDQSLGEGLIVSTLDLRGGRTAGSGEAGVGDFVGRDGYVEFTRTYTEDFEGYEIEVEQIMDAGKDRVVLITRHRAPGKGSQVPVEMRSGAVFTLAGRHIVRVDVFGEPDDALEAAGRRE
jgi:ketosteroid isomerase-like protein